MQVEFLSRFGKDLDRINSSKILSSVKSTIELLEQANDLSQIQQLKKLTGFKDAYRIRIGDYRIGIFVSKGIVQFARIVHRKDIYKVFP